MPGVFQTHSGRLFRSIPRLGFGFAALAWPRLVLQKFPPPLLSGELVQPVTPEQLHSLGCTLWKRPTTLEPDLGSLGSGRRP